MSYVTVFGVTKDGFCREVGTARNNHGLAPLVWRWLSEKYIPGGPSFFGDMSALWSLANDRRLPSSERLLLEATFDGAWVPRSKIGPLIDAMLEFHAQYVVPNKKVETARAATQLLHQVETTDDFVGAAFQMCSATDNPWSRWDEVSETEVAVNVLTDEENEVAEIFAIGEGSAG